MPSPVLPGGAARGLLAVVAPAVFAHRGCTEADLENTIDAFVAARRLGAHGVELDVRRTGDGELIVLHDPSVPGAGLVSNLTMGDLPSHMPQLADALRSCQGMTVNVEIKNAPGDPNYDPAEAIARQTAEVIAGAGWTERALVSSFSAATLEAVRGAAPDLALGWLLGPGVDPLVALDRAVAERFAAIHPFVSQVGSQFMTRCRTVGMAVNVWTVNVDDDLRAMVGWRVDAIITDRPRRALEIVSTMASAGSPRSGDEEPPG